MSISGTKLLLFGLPFDEQTPTGIGELGRLVYLPKYSICFQVHVFMER